jgi:hypothetical protein
MNNDHQHTPSMVEVFISNVSTAQHAERVADALSAHSPRISVHLDLDVAGEPFPCRHAVIRAEGPAIDNYAVIAIVNRAGFKCEVLEERLCV